RSDGVSQVLANVFDESHKRPQMQVKGRGPALIQVIENPTCGFVLAVRHWSNIVRYRTGDPSFVFAAPGPHARRRLENNVRQGFLTRAELGGRCQLAYLDVFA